MQAIPIEEIGVRKVRDSMISHENEPVVIEEPLSVTVTWSSPEGKLSRQVAVILRTPGNDDWLAAGYLFSEGVVNGKSSIDSFRQKSNEEIEVILMENETPDFSYATRTAVVNASCGMCGKILAGDVIKVPPVRKARPELDIKLQVIFSLAELLRVSQPLFSKTGGIHAAGIFNVDGKLVSIMEDIGRHNALDKLIGYGLMNDVLPMNDHLLMLSGRAGFEMIQKAAVAGFPVVVSVGAPSSMAVSLAKDCGITLLGFLREKRFNIYSQFDSIN